MSANFSRRGSDMRTSADRGCNRRGLIGAGALLGALAGRAAKAAPQTMAVKSNSADTRSRTSLHQEVAFEAAPSRVYDALMSAKAFGAFSTLPAAIDPKPGGAISLFGGQIVGRNIELIPGRRIVQAWRAIGDFPSGVYSLVKMELTPRGSGTALALDHTGFPEGHYDHLYAGWGPHYWTPLRKFLA
jgi:activator of HSP90 ATPase